MTRWASHDFTLNPANNLCAVCNNPYARVWHIPPTGHMRTAEGELVAAHQDHGVEVPCEGQRAEKAIHYEGTWHWFCLTCGALWARVRQGTLEYLRWL